MLIAERNAEEGPNGVHHAVTKFCDLTPEEFKSKYLGRKPRKKDPNEERITFDTTDLAASVDWRTKGAVTEVVD